MTMRLTTAIAAVAVLALAPAAYAGQQGGSAKNGGHQQGQNNRQSAPHPNKQAFKNANKNAAFLGSNGQQNHHQRGFSNGQQRQGNPGASNGQQGRGNPGSSNGRQGRDGRGH